MPSGVGETILMDGAASARTTNSRVSSPEAPSASRTCRVMVWVPPLNSMVVNSVTPSESAVPENNSPSRELLQVTRSSANRVMRSSTAPRKATSAPSSTSVPTEGASMTAVGGVLLTRKLPSEQAEMATTELSARNNRSKRPGFMTSSQVGKLNLARRGRIQQTELPTAARNSRSGPPVHYDTSGHPSTGDLAAAAGRTTSSTRRCRRGAALGRIAPTRTTAGTSTVASVAPATTGSRSPRSTDESGRSAVACASCASVAALCSALTASTSC